MAATLAQVLTQLSIINRKLDVTTIEAGVASLATAEAAIQAEIAALKAANPALDLTGLDKAAADLTGAVSGISAIAAPPAS